MPSTVSDMNGLFRRIAPIAWTSVRFESDFSKHPRAPALSTSARTSSDSCIVKIRIEVWMTRRILRVASSPFNSGMLMSRTTTSGRSAIAWATAALPVLASPHTTHPSTFSITARTPKRTTS